jgi:hypothetical protein
MMAIGVMQRLSLFNRSSNILAKQPFVIIQHSQ